MFDYFRNYSSNAHQVCCEDSPTKGLYDHCQSDDLDLHSRSQVHLKLDYFLTCSILDSILDIQTWHDGRLMDVISAHARFSDLDLDARSQWVSKGNKIGVECSRQERKQSALNFIQW